MFKKINLINIETTIQTKEKIMSNVLTDTIQVSWTQSLILFFLLFCIGVTGIIFNYRNYLATMLCIEMMYLGLTICFIIVGLAVFDTKGQIYGLSLIIIAAAESAIGLGLLVVLFRFGGSILFREYQNLKG